MKNTRKIDRYNKKLDRYNKKLEKYKNTTVKYPKNSHIDKGMTNIFEGTSWRKADNWFNIIPKNEVVCQTTQHVNPPPTN